MILENLSLINFKNYSNEQFEFSTNINCFVGQNGSGKTNILDAIYYLAMTKSHLQSKDKILINSDSNFFLIKCLFTDRQELKKQIQAAFQIGKRKIIKLDDVPYKKAIEHIGEIPVVLVTPYDTDVIREGGETRRKFFDQLFCQLNLNYLQDLVKYQNLVKSRNSLLKHFKEKDYFDKDLLETYNSQLYPLNSKLSSHRKAFTSELIKHFDLFYKGLSGLKKEKVELSYKTNVEGDQKQLFADNLTKDKLLCRTSIGIHKDDYVFTLEDELIKEFGSQGQQKSYILALQLAKFKLLKDQLGKTPILMLDDIFDKLDQDRIKQLLSLISDTSFGQIFITDTNQDRLKKLLAEITQPTKYFLITNGSSKVLT